VATADSGLGHEDTRIYANSRTKLDASTNVQGGIYQANNTLNPDGTYSGDLIYQGSKSVQFMTTWESQRGNSSLYVYRNQLTIPSPTVSAVDINTIGLGINEDRTYNLELRVKSPVATISTNTFDFNLSENSYTTNQIWYSSSRGKWQKQKWTCYEHYNRKKETAMGYISTANAGNKVEAASVKLQNLGGYGAWWLAAWAKRSGDVTESTGPLDSDF